MGLFKKKFRNIKKLPTWIFWFPATFLKVCKLLMRTKLIDDHGHLADGRPFVTVTWHNRLLFFPAMFTKPVRRRTRAVVSPSRDGQYVVDLISHFDLISLRGSTSKKGANALKGAIREITNGNIVSFTPDGPRGPRYSMSCGPVRVAQKTGVKIVPISINASSYWELRSWDRFQIPKPWAKIEAIMGEGIEIPSEIKEEELEQWCEKVREKLLEITMDRDRPYKHNPPTNGKKKCQTK